MAQTTPFETYPEIYDAWFDEHPEIFASEIAAIQEHMNLLPENIQGIEIGMGSGRYALELGIMEGIEPAQSMRKLASERGLYVMDAVAESLPYRDLHFDFVLFTTICHLDHVGLAFHEAYRVLKPRGRVIVAFLDANRPIAALYNKKRKSSHFLKQARFYSVHYVEEALKNTGFKDLYFNQTLFQEFDNFERIEDPKPGFGEGSFVVVSAIK